MGSKTVVLVTGATGMCGSEVCRQLADVPGVEVRAAVHSPEKASRLPPAAIPVSFENANRAAVDAAMRGVDRLFLLTPGGPLGPPANRLIVASARHHGVKRIVKLSSFRPERQPQVPTDIWAVEIESMLRDCGIPCTFLQPPWFDQNFTLGHFAPMIGSRHLALPFGDGRCAWVDTRDIAAVACRAILEDGHDGQTYVPTGPEAVSMAEIAAVLSEVTGRTIHYHPLTEKEWIAAALAHGEPEEIARAGFSLMNKTAQGHIPDVSDDIERVTGRQARSFADFARDHAGLLTTLAQAGR